MVVRVEMHLGQPKPFGLIRWRKLGQRMPALRYEAETIEDLRTWIRNTCKAIEDGTDPQPLLTNLDQ